MQTNGQSEDGDLQFYFFIVFNNPIAIALD